jgi:NDP-mannose synthase
MKAVILAGGLGTRLRPFSEVIPKPLLPLGEKAITEVQIQQLRNAGCTDVYLATNYMSNYIEAFLGDGHRYGLRLHYSKESEPLGTCGPIKLLQDDLTEPFLVMNGDILTKLDFGAFHGAAVRTGSLLTVATKVITTPFRFGNVTVNAFDEITAVDEKPEFTLEIVAGIYSMSPEVFDYIPDGKYYGMDSLIKQLLANGQVVSRHLIREYWLDIGMVDDYSQARAEYAAHFAETA